MYWTLLLNIATTTLIGGSSFFISTIVDSNSYALFSTAHISAVYISAILQLSIASIAPKLIAQAYEKQTNAVPSLIKLSLIIEFSAIVIGVTFAKWIAIFYKLPIELIYFTIALTLLFHGVVNIGGILYGAGHFRNSAIFQGIFAALYIFILYFFTDNNNVDYFYMSSSLVLVIVFMIFYCVHLIKKIPPPFQSTIDIFKNGSFVKYLLPSAAAGVLNGSTLYILFSSLLLSSASNLSNISGLGYLLIVKSAGTFLNNALIRFLFFKNANLLHSGKENDITSNIKKTICIMIVSLLGSIILLYLIYNIFFDEYFKKYSYVLIVDYYFLGVLIFFELIFQALYQKIQLYGLITKSLLYISFPTFLISIFFSALGVINSISNYLLIQIFIMIFSILALSKIKIEKQSI